jgi:hypothetical protein
MGFKGGGWKGIECINLAQSRENWQVLAKMAVKISVPYNAVENLNFVLSELIQTGY